MRQTVTFRQELEEWGYLQNGSCQMYFAEPFSTKHIPQLRFWLNSQPAAGYFYVQNENFAEFPFLNIGPLPVVGSRITKHRNEVFIIFDRLVLRFVLLVELLFKARKHQIVFALLPFIYLLFVLVAILSEVFRNESLFFGHGLIVPQADAPRFFDVGLPFREHFGLSIFDVSPVILVADPDGFEKLGRFFNKPICLYRKAIVRAFLIHAADVDLARLHGIGQRPVFAGSDLLLEPLNIRKHGRELGLSGFRVDQRIVVKRADFLILFLFFVRGMFGLSLEHKV